MANRFSNLSNQLRAGDRARVSRLKNLAQESLASGKGVIRNTDPELIKIIRDQLEPWIEERFDVMALKDLSKSWRKKKKQLANRAGRLGAGVKKGRDRHAKGNVDKRGFLRVTDSLFLPIRQRNVAIGGQATGFLKDEIFKTIQANTLQSGEYVSAAIELAADGVGYQYNITIHPGGFYKDYPLRVQDILKERWMLTPDPGTARAIQMTEDIRLAWIAHLESIAQAATATHIHARSRR